MTGTAASFGLTPLILALIFDNLGFIAGYLIMPVALFGAFFLWQSLGYKNDSQQNSTII